MAGMAAIVTAAVARSPHPGARECNRAARGIRLARAERGVAAARPATALAGRARARAGRHGRSRRGRKESCG